MPGRKSSRRHEAVRWGSRKCRTENALGRSVCLDNCAFIPSMNTWLSKFWGQAAWVQTGALCFGKFCDLSVPGFPYYPRGGREA